MKWNNKQVLVTGGAGFLGSNLVRKLCELEAQVTVMDDFSSAPQSNIPKEVNTVFHKHTEDEDWLYAFPSHFHYDYIYHLGSPSSNVLFQKEPGKCFSSTTDSFLNVLHYASLDSVKKVICPSSGTVYGNLIPP